MKEKRCPCNKVILLGSDDEGLKSIRCGDCGREMTRCVVGDEYQYSPKKSEIEFRRVAPEKIVDRLKRSFVKGVAGAKAIDDTLLAGLVAADELSQAKGAALRAFVEGAKWWEYEKTGFTMFPSEQDKAVKEAARRKYPFEPTLERVQMERLRTVIMDDDPMPLVKFLEHIGSCECRCDPEVGVTCESCISRGLAARLKKFFPEEKDGGGAETSKPDQGSSEEHN